MDPMESFMIERSHLTLFDNGSSLNLTEGCTDDDIFDNGMSDEGTHNFMPSCNIMIRQHTQENIKIIKNDFLNDLIYVQQSLDSTSDMPDEEMDSDKRNSEQTDNTDHPSTR